jgi:very-short-patch-repair endonuclease
LTPVLVLLVAAAVIVAAIVIARFLLRPRRRWPYRKTDRLLSPAERSFFGVLQHAVDSDLCIFAKVRLSDLLWLPKGTEKRQTYLNRIQSKHIDFVLCDSDTTAPRLLIELDDSSHRRASRKDRDAFVDEAVRAAGLPILRVSPKRSYVPQQLGQTISSLLLENADASTVEAASQEKSS